MCIIINTEDGHYEYADNWNEAQLKRQKLEDKGHTFEEFTGDI